MPSQRASFVVNHSAGTPSACCEPSSTEYCPLASSCTFCNSVHSALPPCCPVYSENITPTTPVRGVPSADLTAPLKRTRRGTDVDEVCARSAKERSIVARSNTKTRRFIRFLHGSAGIQRSTDVQIRSLGRADT